MNLGLKKWMNGDAEPRDFYDLLDCRRLESRQDVLLSAIDHAHEFLHNYQSHGNEQTRERAMTFQRRLAKARWILSDPARWSDYDRGVKDRLKAAFQHHPAPAGGWSEDHVKTWLLEEHVLAPQRWEEVFEELKTVKPLPPNAPKEVELTEVLIADADDPSGDLPGETVAKISATMPVCFKEPAAHLP